MFDVNKINHADIPGFLKSQGAIGLGGYQKLLDFGHSKSALDAAIRDSGIKIGSKLQASMPNRVPASSSSKYTAPGIGNLSAHDYNKVRTSYDKYQLSQMPIRRRGFDKGTYVGRLPDQEKAYKARESYKRGSYGIEDEYRFMLSQGFQPQGLTPVPAAEPEPEPQRNTGPVEEPGRLNVGTQPQVDPMEMYMPLLLEALRPKPIQQLPEPTTYASAGQAARSVPGVKIRRSSASSSGQNTLGTSGSFNRGNLRISNLNIQ